MGTTFTVIRGAITPGAGSLTVPPNSTLVGIEVFSGGSSAAYGTGGGGGGRDYLACSYAAGTVINFYAPRGGLASDGALPGGGGGYVWAAPAPITSYTYAPVRAKGGGTGSAGKQINVGYGPHGGHGHTANAKTGGDGGNTGYGGAGGGAGGANGPGGAGGSASAIADGGGGSGAPSGGHAGYSTTTSAGANGGYSFGGAMGGAGGASGIGNPGVAGGAGAGSGGGSVGASGAKGSNGTDGIDSVHGAGAGGAAGGYNGGTGGDGGEFGGGGGAGGYIAALSDLDTINFGQFTDGTLYPNNTAGTTVGGVTFHVSTDYSGGFCGQTQGGDWQGIFWSSIYSGAVIFNGRPGGGGAHGIGPITLTFNAPIKGIEKVAVQANNGGPFTGYVKAYAGATLLGQNAVNADNNFLHNTMPPMFFASSSANITKIVFSATNNSQGIGLGPCEAPSPGPGMGGDGGAGGIIFKFTTTTPPSTKHRRASVRWPTPAYFSAPAPQPEPAPPAMHTGEIGGVVASAYPAFTMAGVLTDTRGPDTGAITQTFGAMFMAGVFLDAPATKTEIGVINQTFPRFTQAGVVTKTTPVPQETGAILQTFPAFNQHGTLLSTHSPTTETGAILQTFAPFSQLGAMTDTRPTPEETGTITQTFPAMRIAGTLLDTPNSPTLIGAIGQTFMHFSMSGALTVTHGPRTGRIAQTFLPFHQEGILLDNPGPTLANVTYDETANVPAGAGGVRLSSPGLGLLVAGPVAAWTVVQTGGTAGHWNLPPAMVAEGAMAITPTPSVAGAAAQLNGGPYTFTARAYNAGGAGNLASITIDITPATMPVSVRFGDQTRAGAGGVPVTGTTIIAGDPDGNFQIVAGMLSLTAMGVGLPRAPYVLTLNDGSTVDVAKDAGAWDIATQQDWDNQAAVWSNGKTQWGQDAMAVDGSNPSLPAVNAYANLQFTANPSSGTVTIAGHVYTPAIGSSAAATAAELAAQINALPDANVTAAYSLGTSGQAPTVTVTAIASGTAGNNLALSCKLPVLASGAQNAAANVQSGQTLFIRSGAVIGYHGKLQNLSFASPVSVISRDLNRLQAAAFPHQPWGTLPALTGLATFIDDFSEISGANTRLIIQGMRFAPSPMTRLYVAGSASLAIDWNLFEGVAYDPTAYTNGAGQAAGQFPNLGDVIITNGLTNQNLAITNNWFNLVGHGVIATPAPGGTLTITGNVVDGWYNGAFQVGYPGAPFNFTFTDNCIARCASLAADRGNPHSNPLHVTTASPPGGSTLALNVQRNRMWTGLARGDDWAMRFESAPETGLVYSGSVIGNVMVELASGSNHLEFISTNGLRLINNTVVGDAVAEEFPIVINWEAGGTVSGATVSTKNVAETISLAAPFVETHDVQLGALGATIAYTTAFAGPTFNPPDLATLMTAFAMKVGGPLDVGGSDGTGIGVGAIGSGAVTWASTCPGSDGTSHVT